MQLAMQKMWVGGRALTDSIREPTGPLGRRLAAKTEAPENLASWASRGLSLQDHPAFAH